MTKTAFIVMVLAAIIPSHSPFSKELPKLSRLLSGKSVQCGKGSDLYFDPAMRVASVVDEASGSFPIVESQTTIEPSRIKSDDIQIFEVILKTREGETRHRFERRSRIFLRFGDSEDGDECVLSDGRAAYVETRFNIIREGICGNDPAPSCEAGLVKTCGPNPDAACVLRFATGRR